MAGNGRKTIAADDATTPTKSAAIEAELVTMMVDNKVEHQAIFSTPEHTVYVSYEVENGLMFIVDVHIQPRPVTAFQDRHAKRRYGLVLDAAEEHAEAMLPTTRRELPRRIGRGW
jgi:hypothetical protein